MVKLSYNEKTIIKEYVNKIINDTELKSDLVGNKGKNLKSLYDRLISRKLNNKFLDFFIQNNPEKLTEYLETGMNKFLNFQAFKLSADKLGLIEKHSDLFLVV